MRLHSFPTRRSSDLTAKSILERLAKGPEPLVRNAVAKAMRRCRQRYTEDVEETRLRWLKDRDRSATAELMGPLKKRS